MTLSLERHPKFSGRNGPVVIVVADGIGVAPAHPSNAASEADTPTLDKLISSTMSTELAAHGTAVGLPTDEDMGNSEVGHNAMGSGRIFAQGAKLVNKAIEEKSLFLSDVWQTAIDQAKQETLHLIGLHSDGNVHSHNDHLYSLILAAVSEGVSEVRVHILLDGRDTPPRSAEHYINQTEEFISQVNTQYEVNIQIASGGGRMAITMDRYDADWRMVERGYNCHTHGVGRSFSSAQEAINILYEETNIGDQYLEPFVIVGDDGEPIGKIRDGDSVILFNFRGDRAIEISRAYEETEFDKFDRGNHPDVFFAGMLQYDGDLLIPKNYLVDPPFIDRTMGEYLASETVPSFAISETQKFGHVTYFWNGNRSGYIDEQIETYVEIPSDNCPFDEAPTMKADEITDATIALLRSGKYRFGRVNYANGDMVGHTGNVEAAIKAVETVDSCVARLVEVIDQLGGILIYTSDHGNADRMFIETDDGSRVPVTSHTLSPVPFVIHDPQFENEYNLIPPEDAGLTHIAATVFNLLGYEAPVGYQPSLLSF